MSCLLASTIVTVSIAGTAGSLVNPYRLTYGLMSSLFGAMMVRFMFGLWERMTQFHKRGENAITHGRDSLGWQKVSYPCILSTCYSGMHSQCYPKEAKCLTFISALSQHGGGEAGCLDLLAPQAQRGLRSLNPPAHMLAKDLTSQIYQHS